MHSNYCTQKRLPELTLTNLQPPFRPIKLVSYVHSKSVHYLYYIRSITRKVRLNVILSNDVIHLSCIHLITSCLLSASQPPNYQLAMTSLITCTMLKTMDIVHCGLNLQRENTITAATTYQFICHQITSNKAIEGQSISPG